MTTVVHHVNLPVPAGAAAGVAAFYRDVLGLVDLERGERDRPGAWLGDGNGIEVHLSEREGAAHPEQHVAFLVADVAAVRAHVGPAGVVRDDGADRIFVRDPAGNLLEILGHPDAAR